MTKKIIKKQLLNYVTGNLENTSPLLNEIFKEIIEVIEVIGLIIYQVMEWFSFWRNYTRTK